MTRQEKDSLGVIDVPSTALWGAQTQRALINFAIGSDPIPIEIIHSLAIIKKASAIVNSRLGVIDNKSSHLIINAADQIENGLHDKEFPLKVWQSGSGTQSNMNVNEVISNLISKGEGYPLGSNKPVHPNDHVNRSQSTNDTFPSAIHIATIKKVKNLLLPELEIIVQCLEKKEAEWQDIIKIARTHLQDAVPMTLGQEVSAWRMQIQEASRRLEESLVELYSLPLGGTAVGTGLNTPEKFADEINLEVSRITGLPFRTTENKFSIMASHDGLLNTMSKLKLLAISLLKISNDIRLLSCGPRAGLGELKLPENEPGSSIMPGKVNPTQCEAMAMICTQVIGCELAVSIAGGGGHLQMNAYKPLIGFNLLKSIEMLYSACISFRIKMLEDIQPDEKKISEYLDKSLMLVTALAPKIGYDKACKIAQVAHKESINLKDAALRLKYINESEFDQIVRPINMIPKEN